MVKAFPCLSSQSPRGWSGQAHPTLALESGQSQDEYPQTPGSSGQHWVLCVALIPERESRQCGLMQQLCVCVLASPLKARNAYAHSDQSQSLKGQARPALRHPR